MAEADTDPPNTMEDEDLEDGEIETDEENDVVVNEVKPAARLTTAEATATATTVIEQQAKKSKISEDDLKKATDTKAKSDNRKSTQDNNTKIKKLSTNDIAKGERNGLSIVVCSI